MSHQSDPGLMPISVSSAFGILVVLGKVMCLLFGLGLELTNELSYICKPHRPPPKKKLTLSGTPVGCDDNIEKAQKEHPAG